MSKCTIDPSSSLPPCRRVTLESGSGFGILSTDRQNTALFLSELIVGYEGSPKLPFRAGASIGLRWGGTTAASTPSSIEAGPDGNGWFIKQLITARIGVSLAYELPSQRFQRSSVIFRADPYVGALYPKIKGGDFEGIGLPAVGIAAVLQLQIHDLLVSSRWFVEHTLSTQRGIETLTVGGLLTTFGIQL